MFTEVVKRVGPDITRERFIDAAKSLHLSDLGSLAVDFTKSNTGLTYTNVFVIASSGKVLR
jgi:hypothetical protein